MKRSRIIAIALGVLLTRMLVAQDHALSESATDADSIPRAEQLSKLFAEKAESLELVPEDEGTKFNLVKTPLFSFATEGTVFGSVYVWHDSASRLAAIGTIGSLPINGVDMEFVELHLLKPVPMHPLTLQGFPDKRWTPNVEGLAPKPIPSAPPVAASDRMRLTQMRALARQFSAQMSNNGQTNQLRILPQPLYRYAESTVERDGSLFAFVWDKGTDPELILRIETTMQDGVVSWHYQPIRFTWRALELRHADVEVYRSDEFVQRDSPIQSTPYITGLTAVIP